MERHSLKPHVCRRVSSSNYSRHPLSDSSHPRLTLATVSNKPRVFSSTICQAQHVPASSPSRWEIL
jgi:hypothetical protein